MNRNEKKKLIIGFEMLLFTIIYSCLITCVDVKAIGPNGTEVGFATLNKAYIESVGTNETYYLITQLLGYLALGLFLLFAFMGLVQLIKRKKLFDVDHEILVLGAMLLIMFILYVLFEKYPINYRPIIMSGEVEPEASFPSSHTMLSIVVFCGIARIVDYYFDNKTICKALKILLVILSIIAVVFRTLSGVHWITDIIAGVLISITLLVFYDTFLNIFAE